MLNILVIHGYVQTASTVRANTRRLETELSDIAKLDYVDGPPPPDGSWAPSRPWWFLKTGSQWLDHDIPRENGRWQQTVQWWSNLLSEKQYDGIIGLSQGSAMTALLLSMLNDPSRVPGFGPIKPQPLKFAVLCSGFVSRTGPHMDLYNISLDLPTVHTVDDHDPIVAASRTIELKNMFGEKAMLMKHNEGHSIPCGGDIPKVFKEYILNAVHVYNHRAGGPHHYSHSGNADGHANGHAHPHDPQAHGAHDTHAHDAHGHDAHGHDPHVHGHDSLHDSHHGQAEKSLHDSHLGHDNAHDAHHAQDHSDPNHVSIQDPFASPPHSPLSHKPHRQDTSASTSSSATEPPPVYDAMPQEVLVNVAGPSGVPHSAHSPLTFDHAFAVGAHGNNHA